MKEEKNRDLNLYLKEGIAAMSKKIKALNGNELSKLQHRHQEILNLIFHIAVT